MLTIKTYSGSSMFPQRLICFKEFLARANTLQVQHLMTSTKTFQRVLTRYFTDIPIIYNSYKWSPANADKQNDVMLSCDVTANPALVKRITWYHNSRYHML